MSTNNNTPKVAPGHHPECPVCLADDGGNTDDTTKETNMETNEIVTPNPAHCPTCGGPGRPATAECQPCGGTGSARDAAYNLLESVYEQKATLTNFHMLAKQWEEEVASRQRPLTGAAEMMQHCAREVRRILNGEPSAPLGGGRHG